MSKRLKKHAGLLHYLTRCPNKVKREILKSGDKELMNTLCECSFNILRGTVPLTQTQKRKLKTFKKQLRVLASRTTSQRNKRALLQKGGFLGALLAPLGGILSSILGSTTNT